MNDIKTEITREMQDYFGTDTKRISHALKVTAYCEQLLPSEGGNYRVVIAAGLLHDIGIHEAERKHGSTAGHYQEVEGPPIARRILTEIGLPAGEIEEICTIIAHHHSPGKVNTQNFKILYDADWLVNLRDEYDIREPVKLRTIIDRVILTVSGKALARKVYAVGE